jgi:hypothetical protein
MGHPTLAILLLVFVPASATAEDSRPFSFGLDLQGTEYVDKGRSYFRDDANKANLALGFETRADVKQDSGYRFAWDIRSQYSFIEKWNYFKPAELYAGVESDSGGIWFGRKKFTYSQWEERWNTGLFQPRYMDDKLHPTTAGLIGLFAEKKYKSVRFLGGLLPVSVPELGPHYWIADGDMVSPNPWFNPPPASFQYGGQETAIDYSVKQPDTWSAVSKPGAVLQVEADLSDSVLVRTSYAYKPMPQMLLAFPIVLLLPGTAYVELKPRFLYHHVVNQDLVIKSGPAEYGLSAAHESPVQDKFPDDWEKQETRDATFASAYATTTLDDSKQWCLTGSVLKIWGGDRPDSGPVETNRTLFERRFQFTEAGSLELRKRWSINGWPGLNSGLKVIYDRLQSGIVYSGDIVAKFNDQFAVRASADFFDLAAGHINMPDGFLNVYRGNDRFSLGITYGF